MSDDSDPVLCETTEGVALITLNRPHKLNALNYALIDRLLDHLDRIEADGSIAAVVVTGAGERAFSAGADIHEFAESVRQGPDVALRAFVRRGQRLTARIEAFPKPIIAAVNGLAFGGGCEVVEAMHLAVASEDALFSKSEITIGMMPTFGGTQRLPRLVGRKRALELLLTGEPFPASRALELGLVQQVVPRAELLTRAHALARQILRHSPDAVARILAAVTRGLNATIGEGLAIEAEQFARHVHSPTLKERLDAWIGRRGRNHSPATAEPSRRASSSISGR